MREHRELPFGVVAPEPNTGSVLVGGNAAFLERAIPTVFVREMTEGEPTIGEFEFKWRFRLFSVFHFHADNVTQSVNLSRGRLSFLPLIINLECHIRRQSIPKSHQTVIGCGPMLTHPEQIYGGAEGYNSHNGRNPSPKISVLG